MTSDKYLVGLHALSQAMEQLPTCAELEPALVELGEAVEEAWQAVMPWAVVYCSDERLRLITGRDVRRNWVARFWNWLRG